jgi:phosphatidylinositol-4-phosphate 3-kinase
MRLYYFEIYFFQIPPLPMNYRPTVTPAICAPKSTFYIDDEQLNVLKVIEKKPNSNLIDLNNFEQLDKTNVRVSVLEAFDPLLVKIDGNDSTQERKDGNFMKFNMFLYI